MNKKASDPDQPNRSLTYHSLVIRYWRESLPSDGAAWRCLLIDPQTGRQRGFQSFAELGAFLAEEFGEDLWIKAGREL